MDWHELMSSLQKTADLDLLRLRTAIDHLLQQPGRIIAIRQRLQLGQKVDYWNLRENRMQPAASSSSSPSRCSFKAMIRPSIGGCPTRRSRSTRRRCLELNLIHAWIDKPLRSETQ